MRSRVEAADAKAEELEGTLLEDDMERIEGVGPKGESLRQGFATRIAPVKRASTLSHDREL